jgi:tetratricopeptide (TPR) repeat protein
MRPEDAMTILLDDRGLAVSPSDIESLDRYNAAVISLHSYRGDARDRIEQLLARDLAFVAGHCLRAAALVLSTEVPGDTQLAQTLHAIAKLDGQATDRERRHAAAASAWFEGDIRAATQRYGELVVDYPRDSVALQVAHALDFRLGQRTMLRDRVAEVFPHWDASVPGFGYVLGMYAFGLEESGDYARGEALARRSLELEPFNAAAIHVVAHVMEMQGRALEGIEWLHSNRDIWSANAGFAIHIAWHLALFHIDCSDTDKALAIYDEIIAPSPASAINALVDASALLWRLCIRDVDPQNRWDELADCWNQHALAGRRAFTLVHAVMAFAAAGRIERAQRVFELLRRDARTRAANIDDDLRIAVPLAEALLAFSRNDYARAVEGITTVRVIADRCGGSVAQCDLIHLTLIEAALRCRRAPLAQALAAERNAQKPDSLLNRWLFTRAAGALAVN